MNRLLFKLLFIEALRSLIIFISFGLNRKNTRGFFHGFCILKSTWRTSGLLPLTATFWILSLSNTVNAQKKIIVYPAPAGEILNSSYEIRAAGKSVDVYNVKIAAMDSVRRFKAVDDILHSADYYDNAAFCYFAIREKTQVTIKCKEIIRSVKVLPTSFGLQFKFHNHTIDFNISPGQNVTVETNGDIVHSLHIFANLIEKKPRANDPNIIYFGPGIHEVTSMVIGDNKTVYIAGGAIVKAVIGKHEKYSLEPNGLRNYLPTFILTGHNIKFAGQGIIDGSDCTTHARNLVKTFRANGVIISGIILINPSGWTMPIAQSDNVTVNNVKILGYRANSDGIDICNSRNILINNCFIRTNDDLIVVKTFEKQGLVNNIIVKKCILWNQLANALSLGAELRENVSNVFFSDCDIIHDTGREWSLRIFQCDSSNIKNIHFENLRIEQSRQCISLWIGKAGPSLEKGLGVINNVIFKNINIANNPLGMEIIGGDPNHEIKNISFTHILMAEHSLSRIDMRINPYSQNISFSP